MVTTSDTRRPEQEEASKARLRCPVGEKSCAHLDELSGLRAKLQTLSREVRTDALTGLLNYGHFTELLEQEVERSKRSGLPLGLVMVDLDHFKQVNDRWGHEVGNQVLIQVADILRKGVRRIDTVCRYGGEEMVLVLPGTQLPKAIRAAERIRACIEQAVVPHGDLELRVSASLGVAVYPYQGVADGTALVQKADELMYQAKHEGRNRVCHLPLVPESQVSLDEKKALLE